MTAYADFGIAPTTARRLREVFDSASGLQRVWIFGSRARNTARPESDIDLAIEAPGWSFPQLASLMAQIESLNLLYKVDCVLLHDVSNAPLATSIARDRQVFWVR